MSGENRWGFPFKDLARRKFQTGLTIASLAVCVSVTVFLVLFAEDLGIELALVAGGESTIGFSVVYSRFILLVVLFNSVAGILVAYFLITVSMLERVRDIGIMKAVGCLTDVVFGYFETEILVIVLTSCLLGVIGGVSLNYASASLMSYLGFHISVQPIDTWFIVLVIVGFAFVFFILGTRRIVKAAGIEPVRAFSLSPWTTSRSSATSFPTSLGGGFASRMASRGLSRLRSATIQSVTCLSIVMVLVTLAVVGGVVANETMQSYVERAIGTNTVLIAETELAERYESLLRASLETVKTEAVHYLDERYCVPDSVISRIGEVKGVTKVDARLILEEVVEGYAHIRPDPEKGQYTVTGTYRSAKALVVGVRAESVVSNWLVLGKTLDKMDLDSVLVGDSLASTLFDDPFAQKLGTLNSRFDVAGICLDPLNNGMVVYMHLDRLSSLLGHEGCNALLIQVDTSDSLARSGVLADLSALISRPGLTLVDLNVSLDVHKAFLNRLWSLLLSLSLFSFANAVFSLMGYLMLSISGQQRDFAVMRALGAKPETVSKLVLLETTILVLAGGAIGLPIGTIVVFWFFIPEPVISATATLAIVGVLSVLLGALCVSTLYPARRMTNTRVTDGVSQL